MSVATPLQSLQGAHLTHYHHYPGGHGAVILSAVLAGQRKQALIAFFPPNAFTAVIRRPWLFLCSISRDWKSHNEGNFAGCTGTIGMTAQSVKLVNYQGRAPGFLTQFSPKAAQRKSTQHSFHMGVSGSDRTRVQGNDSWAEAGGKERSVA